jgi:hypothetical protein
MFHKLIHDALNVSAGFMVGVFGYMIKRWVADKITSVFIKSEKDLAVHLHYKNMAFDGKNQPKS